jgi:hypothetical protein
LPWDIVGLFQLFVFDQKKKVISVLDPLPARDLGKNILKAVGKTFNLVFQVAHPESKDDIYRWGCRVPIVPTDEDVYESCQDITILLIYSLHNITFRDCRALSGYLVFNFMHSWYDGALFYPIPTVSTSPCQFIYMLHMNLS